MLISKILVVCAGVVAVGAGLAQANFVAYNDLASDLAGYGNVTTISSGQSGVLKDYSTGASTGVALQVTAAGVFVDQTYDVADFAGGDALTEFGTIVNNNGYIRYADTPVSLSYATCTFTGLNPSKVYTVVLTGARGNSAYTARHTIFQISDVDAFTNASSTGATFSGPADPTVEFNTGYNTAASSGYVARFTNVHPGSDGDMVVTAGLGPHNTDGMKWYVNELKLIEVPEPSTVTLLVLGGLALLRRR
jgi:hypothetical protein